jgi:hypothetical protein
MSEISARFSSFELDAGFFQTWRRVDPSDGEPPLTLTRNHIGDISRM